MSSSAEPPSASLDLIAYQLNRSPSLRLVAAPVQRDFMEATPMRFALRCLPMLLANQAGWFLLNQHPVMVVWNGGDQLEDLTVSSPPGVMRPATSHFGHGILTWDVPYLFRTPPGYNLCVRGPTNWPRDGASALEGIVETDWSLATFTMNWKITRAGVPIFFHPREPICQILPMRRGELEQFKPVLRPIESEPETHKGYRAWSESRAHFLRDLPHPESEAAARRPWQRHYFQGTTPSGAHAPGEHQTRLVLREFELDDSGGSPHEH
ncbi:MAG: hypothetical protein E6J90_03315 [Deltaproteobacteria bacterium]|nr:MAG: hypothetical protein E6J91_16575 [Deltaproteobacteria bacterium]TMQ27055.1 MAG: hypothetical protein E6J90_03315 [Deltaproteobacteria bacterium]